MPLHRRGGARGADGAESARLDRHLAPRRKPLLLAHQIGNEVDFVIYGEDGLWAFEVKNGVTVGERDLRGLRAFLEDYPEVEARLLYRGDERLEIRRIRCEPCEGYLASIRPGQPLR